MKKKHEKYLVIITRKQIFLSWSRSLDPDVFIFLYYCYNKLTKTTKIWLFSLSFKHNKLNQKQIIDHLDLNIYK